MLLEAMARQDGKALIAGSANFYGPGARNRFWNISVFNRLQAGKAPQWVGGPKTVHDFTDTPNAGKALAALALRPR